MAKGRTVAVRITADTKGLVAGVMKAEVTLGNLRKTAVAGTAVLAKFAAAGAAAAAGALTALYARTAPLIDANAKLADRLNMSTEALGGLQLQATLSGVSSELLSKSMDKMSVSIGNAARLGGATAKSFENIGLNVRELAGLSADEQFKRIADGISSLKTASAQAAAANAIFGKSGVQMLNMLREGSPAIEAAQKRAEAYGTALSRVDSAKVEAANDAWDETQTALQGIANKITVKLAPLVEVLSKMFSDAALESKGFGDTIDKAFTGAVKTVGFFADVVQGLRVAFKGVELVVFTLEASIVEVFNAATQTIAMSLEGWLGMYDMAIRNINKKFGKNFATFDFKAANSPFVKTIADMSEVSLNHIGELAGELQALAMQEMPSSTIDAFVAKVQAESQKAAEAVAQSRKDMFAESEDGGSTEGLEKEYEKFREMHLSREAAEIESLTRSLDELKKFHKAGLVSTGQYWGKTAQMTLSMLTNMSASVANHSKKAFELNKKLSIATAIMNTYEMATSAYKALAGIPYVGPVLGAAAAAAAIKFGQMQIQGIKSSQYGGGTAPSAANTPAPATSSVGGGSAGGGAGGSQQTMLVQGLDPNAIFSGRQMIDMINEAQKDGAKIVFA
jgi:hypothetical protein